MEEQGKDTIQKKKGFYSWEYKTKYGLKANAQDQETVMKILKLLNESQLTVERSIIVLDDVKTILPSIVVVNY